MRNVPSRLALVLCFAAFGPLFAAGDTERPARRDPRATLFSYTYRGTLVTLEPRTRYAAAIATEEG